MTGRPTHNGWDVNYMRHKEQAKGKNTKKHRLVYLVIT